jgi:hypothetical protein
MILANGDAPKISSAQLLESRAGKIVKLDATAMKVT